MQKQRTCIQNSIKFEGKMTSIWLVTLMLVHLFSVCSSPKDVFLAGCAISRNFHLKKAQNLIVFRYGRTMHLSLLIQYPDVGAAMCHTIRTFTSCNANVHANAKFYVCVLAFKLTRKSSLFYVNCKRKGCLLRWHPGKRLALRFTFASQNAKAQSTQDACAQIRMQTLWCCLRAVWTPPFMHRFHLPCVALRVMSGWGFKASNATKHSVLPKVPCFLRVLIHCCLQVLAIAGWIKKIDVENGCLDSAQYEGKICCHR